MRLVFHRAGLLAMGLAALVACGESAPAGATPAEPAKAAPPELCVAAAASLRELCESTRGAFAAAHGGAKLSFSFEASSTLSRQIEEGGAFGAFLSADAANVDRIAPRLQADTRRVFLGTIPPNGILDTSIFLGDLGPGVEARTWQVQVFIRDTAGVFRLGSGAAFTVLDSAF